MNYVYGALAGLVWGVLAAGINALISKACLKKNTTTSMMIANVLRVIVDIGALATVYFLRGRLPFSFEAALIATAIAMSMLSIVFAYRLSRPD